MVRSAAAPGAIRGSRGRGSRGARSSVSLDSTSPPRRGRPRRVQPAEDTPETPVNVSGASSPETARRGRVRRVQPTEDTSETPRGRRRSEPPPDSADQEPAGPDVNGLPVADSKDKLQHPHSLSLCTVRLTRTELPLPAAVVSDPESSDMSAPSSVGPVSEENSLMSDSVSADVTDRGAAPPGDPAAERVADGIHYESETSSQLPPTSEPDAELDEQRDGQKVGDEGAVVDVEHDDDRENNREGEERMEHPGSRADSRASSPDSLVQFRDPHAPGQSLGDSMDLDSTLGDNDMSCASASEQRTAKGEAQENDSVAPHVSAAPSGSPSSVLEDRQEPMDCEASLNQAEGTSDHEMPAAESPPDELEVDDRATPIIGAVNGGIARVDAMDSPSPSRSPVIDVMNSSSPAVDVMDSQSPVVDAQDSSSPAVDVMNSQSPTPVVPHNPVVNVVNHQSPEEHDSHNSTVDLLDSRSPAVEVVDTRSPSLDVQNSGSPAIDVLDSRSPAAETQDSHRLVADALDRALDSRSPAVDALDSRSTAADALDSRSPAVDVLDSRSTAADALDSRSPAVDVLDGALDSRSPALDALDSRSPAVDAPDSRSPLPSPVPPPDVDENACSLPPMVSKASDSEDSRPPAPLTTLAARPGAGTDTPEPMEASTGPENVVSSAPGGTSPIPSPPPEKMASSPLVDVDAQSTEVSSPPPPAKEPASAEGEPVPPAEEPASVEGEPAPPAEEPPSVEDEPAPSPMSEDGARSPLIAYSDDDDDLSEFWPLPPSLGRPVKPPSIEGESGSAESDAVTPTPTEDADRPPSGGRRLSSASLDDIPRPSSPLEVREKGSTSPTTLDKKLKSLEVSDSSAKRRGGSTRRGSIGDTGLYQGDVEMRTVSKSDAERAAAVCDIPLPGDSVAPPLPSAPTDMEISTPDGSEDEGTGREPGTRAPAQSEGEPAARRNCSVESGDRASPFMGMFDEDEGPPAEAQSGGLQALRGLGGRLPIVAQSQLAVASRGAVIRSSQPLMVRSDALIRRPGAETGVVSVAAAGTGTVTKAAAQPGKSPQNKVTKPRPSKAGKVTKTAQEKAAGKSGKSPAARAKSAAAAAQLESPSDGTAAPPTGKGVKSGATPPADKAAAGTARATKPKTKFLERLSSGSPSSPKRSPAGGKAAAAAAGQADRRGQSADDSGSGATAPGPLDIPLPPAQGPDGTPGRQQAAKGDGKVKDSRVDAIKDKDINKLRKFKTISDSIWLKKQKLTKQQKEARHMVCDCYLSPEEIERGDMGCGEDCLNRLLMIECGTRCPLGDRCSNKRFTKKEIHPTSVFKTELKGYGLRADVDMPENAFIYEYVGEVLDSEEFKRRTKEYDRLKYHHYYFMALKADAIIDATEKGNASRFINHSCDPNSETQKWTVNGELRIGFFTRRPVSAGEEITFDYQLQRYGKEAQKCFCGSDICRGWIGEKTDDTSSEEEEEEEEPREEPLPGAEDAPPSSVPAVAAEAAAPEQPGAAESQPGQPAAEPRPPKVTKQAKQRRDAERRDLEIEINKLVSSGLKSKQHTLELSRLMVRAEGEAERLTLLELIRTADQPCRRLFLDYHGLRLLWSWMASAPAPQGTNDDEVYRFRRKVLETLATLPIPNKTCLTDSRVLTAVERWAAAGQPATPCTPDQDGTPSDTASGSDTPVSGPVMPTVTGGADCPAAKEVAELASRLLESWSGLQEVFRIPKKERVEIMREHEKEADRGYQTYLQQQPRPGLTAAKKGYDWSPERRKRAWDSPEPDVRVKKYRPLLDSRLTKEERRQLFMLEVQREEEERRQRQQQQQLWRGHEKRCAMLGLDPHLTPIFDPSYQYYWEPSSGAWQPYTPGDPAVPLVPAPGVDPLHVAALPQQLAVYQGMAAVDPAQAEQYLEQVAQQRTVQTAGPLLLPVVPAVPQTDANGLPVSRPGLLELLQAQLPGRFLGEDGREIALSSVPQPDSGAAYRLASYNDPSQPNVSLGNIPLPDRAAPGQPPPPPPPPPEPVITLPPRWRIAKDDNDRIYFYHQVTRQTQWTPPVSADWIPPPGAVTVQQSLWTAGGSSADSSPTDGGSSSDSSSDSSSSSEDESKPGDEEDEPVANELPEDMAKEEDIDRRRMVDQHRRRRGKRRDRLVQERIISPVPEMSKQEMRRERHRLKREAKAEARRERRLDPESAPRGPRPRRRRPAPPPVDSPTGDPEPPDAAEGADPETEPEPAAAEPPEPAAAENTPPGDTEQPPDQSRREKEERIRRFKAKEEALRKHQAKKQEARARRKRKAAAAAAAAAAASSSKKRKIEVKRVSSSAAVSGSSSSVAASSSSSSSSSSRKEKPTTAAADTSSEVARKIKDKFLAQMSGVIVSALNAFRKSGCKQGRITCNEDFKFLAKKLTHHVMVKELKNVQQVEELSASESVKHKAKYYVKKYMGRFGETYSKESLLMEDDAAEAAH
ncbi:probable histone-lysine N-methyltransferase CG1716 [Amphibalanus amphitrite]|uniref:probable histone-lysine N-methyltransferase CG1716 n=1 Tax=Amphibalanus amphitrite TaxID=1232801 RepID=UPI001C92670E|nr:probable histone-lysine N-methyltransferase CG1716 [Amphibalanus amphitrite]